MADLWRDLRTIPGWRDKLRFLFAAPGWYPDSVGGPQPAPDITGEETKFHPRPTRRVALLLLFRFAVVLGGALLALDAAPDLSRPELGVLLVWVFAGLAATGELWNHEWGRGRWLLSLAVDLCLVPAWGLCPALGATAVYPLLALAAVSAAWTWWALSASKRR